MGNRCYLISVLLMILAPPTLASAEAVDRSYGESNSALSPSPFRSSHDTYIPFNLRQGLDAHYVRLSVVTENTIADHERLQPGTSFRSHMPKLVWAAESVYGFTWLSSSLQAFSVSPFGGVGYRAFGPDLASYCCLPIENDGWSYGTVGLRADWKVTPRFRMSPEIAWRIPIAVQTSMRTQDGDEIRLPLRSHIDVILPMTYNFAQNWDAYLAGTVERIYISEGAAELISSGVPLGNFSGHSTQQLGVSFGVRLPF